VRFFVINDVVKVQKSNNSVVDHHNFLNELLDLVLLIYTSSG
jgi:hypothetical protein